MPTKQKKESRPGKEAAPSTKPTTTTSAPPAAQVTMLATRDIGPSPWNRDTFSGEAMDQLIESIRQRGIIQPILIRENPGYRIEIETASTARVVSNTGTPVQGNLLLENAEALATRLNAPLWEIIAGERRWRAAQYLCHLGIPAIQRHPCTDREALELQATENLHREDLNPLHEAQKYQQLLDAYRAEGEASPIARLTQHVGRSRSLIYERIALLNLPAEARAAIAEGRLPASHAALLTKLDTPEVQEELTHRMLHPEEHETDLDEDDQPLVSSLTLMSYRAAKTLVSGVLERQEAARAYDAARDTAKAEGRHILTPAELRAHMPNGYLVGSKDYVEADTTAYEWRDSAGHVKTWRQLLGKHAPPATLGRNRTGGPVDLYPRKALAEAAKAAGLKKPSAVSPRGSGRPDPARLAAEAAHARREARWKAWCADIVPNERLALVLALYDLAANAGIAPALLGLPEDTKESDILDAIPGLPVTKLREILVRQLIENETPYRWHKEWPPLLTLAATLTGHPLPAWDDETSGKEAA